MQNENLFRPILMVVARDSGSLDNEPMARGTVAITAEVSRVLATVTIEYTVSTH